MKRIIIFATMLLLAITITAQVPNKMSYQAVVRNSSNNLVVNQQIGVKISILKTSTTGVPVYIETQTTTTNQNGLMSIIIGNGNSSYNISDVNWTNGSYFIKTETDPEGGTNYIITGISQMLSVPYALHAKTAESISGTITETDPVFGASEAKNITSSNITNWNSAYTWGNHASAGYLKSFTETDPVFGASAAKNITSTNTTNWNSAYTWGNHATAGYLKNYTETDPVFGASAAKNITSTNTTNWNSAYTWGNHASAGYLKSFTETDPVFGASAAKNITSTNTTNWNSAYTWGNHATAGYLKNYTETDPIFDASVAKNITSTNITNWNSAYTWGNHATAGYLKTYTETDPVFNASLAKTITSTNTNNWTTAYSWGNHALAGYLKTYTETDPVFNASLAKTITSTNTNNWTSAYSWGNHALAGYLKTYTETDPNVKAIIGIVKSNGTSISAATKGTDYLAPNGSAANLTNFPILNQNTTGNALNVTGIVAIANGGTGASSSQAALTNLGASTIGANVFTLTNPSAISFLQINANNTVSALSATNFRTAIGAGTITSVSATAPIVSTGGNTPVLSISAATQSAAGSMSSADKIKLDGIAERANNYIHPTGDGNFHVPITETTNSGKVLTAGSTAGSLTWTTPTNGTVTSVTGTVPIISSGGNTPVLSISEATQAVAGSMSAADKTKLDAIAVGAEVNVNADWNASSGDAQILNIPTNIDIDSSDDVTITGNQTIAGNKTLTGKLTVTTTAAIGTSSPETSAALEVSSTSQGFLPPRLTSLQKNAITSPVAGLLIWCSNCGANGEIQVYNGTNWTNMIGGTASAAMPFFNASTMTEIIDISALCSSQIMDDGGLSITARGVCWSKTPNPTITNSKTSDGTGKGTFTSSITGLTSNTLYYARAYATTSSATVYGAQISFTTLKGLPTLTTIASSYLTFFAFEGKGNITDDGGSTITAYGFCWSTSPYPTITGSHSVDGAGTGPFSRIISKLRASTTYYVRAYATNCNGTAYGNQLSYITPTGELPSVYVWSTTTSDYSSATLICDVYGDGGYDVTARGVCWSTSPNPNTANSKTNDGTGTGKLTSTITGLTLFETYYIRPYATNSKGTTYGDQSTFFAFGVGANYQGGKVAYIFTNSDPGYVSGEVHGIIAAPSDQSSEAMWGCSGTTISGADSKYVGSGKQNTIDIEAGCTTPGTAADICANLSLNGYDDWFLPSIEELKMILIKNELLGLNGLYLSSTEWTANSAYGSSASNMSTSPSKGSKYKVRAVRNF
jgi:hypothetical protein